MSYPQHGLNLRHKISRKKATKTVDIMAYIVGVGGNIAVIPQIIKAWESDAPGLAVSTWILFTMIGFIWLAYAILHKQKPLIVAQIVSILCNLLVVIGWMVNNLN
jgi:MtN3 and saliva related transmembrane protein